MQKYVHPHDQEVLELPRVAEVKLWENKMKKEDGPLVEAEADSARLTEDEEAMTGQVSKLSLTLKIHIFTGSLDSLPSVH